MCLALEKVQERQRNEKKLRINLLRTWDENSQMSRFGKNFGNLALFRN